VNITETLDNHGHAQVMRWPVRTCISCAHQDCIRRRSERMVPCVVCGSRILDGQAYRVMARVNGEVVTQVHESCNRRMAGRS
jgi:ribosomal protein S27E